MNATIDGRTVKENLYLVGDVIRTIKGDRLEIICRVCHTGTFAYWAVDANGGKKIPHRITAREIIS